jgi:hypothetical protein
MPALLVAHQRLDPRALPRHGALLADSDGALEELVIHYAPAAGTMVERAYAEFLAQLPSGVLVRVVCPDRAAFEDLRRRIGPVPPTLVPVLTGHGLTAWSRDRWLALGPRRPRGPTTLVRPWKEDAQELWPERAGDARVADLLADRSGAEMRAWRSPLLFDGGDFVADGQTVFVSPRVADRNIPQRVADRASLRDELERLFRKRVVLLEQAPDHHAGMFLMLAGEGRAVVGDPRLARPLLHDSDRHDFSAETAALFDAVAMHCVEAGYRVVRMPVAPGKDGRSWETPLNAIVDQRAGERTVYMPSYRHAPGLNLVAADIWRSLGLRVRGVDCSETFTRFGSLRCLVNVSRRGP